ncbi:hypothetical protein PR002_g21660 [Phytophthora rubi]|uniref:Uncharacterized protein n=1 Tax=Phytophthora rubi TaxID=129364 RepID=A0A6A3J0B5_9STRA|nr:hypothetical protein PR002_g21660 [Phytophthora rubi]
MDIVDEEEPRVGDIKVGAAGDTQRLPDSLPMEDSYLEKEFFVRDCYPVYYDLIINALYKQGMWCVRSLELQELASRFSAPTSLSVFDKKDWTMTSPLLWRLPQNGGRCEPPLSEKVVRSERLSDLLRDSSAELTTVEDIFPFLVEFE